MQWCEELSLYCAKLSVDWHRLPKMSCILLGSKFNFLSWTREPWYMMGSGKYFPYGTKVIMSARVLCSLLFAVHYFFKLFNLSFRYVIRLYLLLTALLFRKFTESSLGPPCQIFSWWTQGLWTFCGIPWKNKLLEKEWND